MRILAFGHRKRVGKDTVTSYALSYLRQFYPKIKCYKLAFGDGLKTTACSMFGWAGLKDGIYYENHPSEIEKPLPEIDKSPRQIWDHLGLTGRQLCPDVWIKIALRGHLANNPDILICKDLRQMNEVALVRSFGGWCVRVDKPDALKGGPIDECLADYDGWDHILLNNSGMKELNISTKLLVDTAVKEWFGGL